VLNPKKRMSCRLALRMPYLAPAVPAEPDPCSSAGTFTTADEVRAAMKGSAELEDSDATELANRVNKTLFF
jgi:hypothetical protein